LSCPSLFFLLPFSFLCCVLHCVFLLPLFPSFVMSYLLHVLLC
jgi:hypothetical protein